MRHPVRLLLGLALIGGLAACGGSASSQPPVATSQPPAPAGVSVDAAEFAFTPAAIEVSAGSEVTITLTNKGTIEHDFAIDVLAVMVHANPGETASGAVTFAAGAYEFYCTIPGHKEAGMVGTLTAN